MLACILGNGGEIFFPKLGEDQMLTFSTICDKFVKAEGFTKVECKNDSEAKKYASAHGTTKAGTITSNVQMMNLQKRLQQSWNRYALTRTSDMTRISV